MSVVAIITARRGSKRLTRKNTRLLNGKPLVEYSLAAGLDCPSVSEAWVTTDDHDVISIAQRMGAGVIDRPEHLCSDTATSYDVVSHALRTLANSGREFDSFVLLQPTSPLRTAQHVDECLLAFEQDKAAKCAMSVCAAEHSPYKMLTRRDGRLEPLFDDDRLNLPDQSLPETLRQNGAIYVMKCAAFLAEATNFFLPPVLAYHMDSVSSLDIDTELDLRIAEHLLAEKRQRRSFVTPAQSQHGRATA